MNGPTDIDRINAAPCHPSREKQRVCDISQAIIILAEEGPNAALAYLESLCEMAESGHYDLPYSPAPPIGQVRVL